MRSIPRETAGAGVATVLLVDPVVVGDLSEPTTVVDNRRAFGVAADKVLVEALGDKEPIRERRLVGDQVPKDTAVPVRVDGPRDGRPLPLVEHP